MLKVKDRMRDREELKHRIEEILIRIGDFESYKETAEKIMKEIEK
jgi:hypothetical protein